MLIMARMPPLMQDFEFSTDVKPWAARPRERAARPRERRLTSS